MDPHSPINSQVELQSPSRKFSYSDILKFTSNFSKLLGEGGFGKVYYGLMGNTEVAVKMLSPKSAQGYREFQAEVIINSYYISFNYTLISFQTFFSY